MSSGAATRTQIGGLVGMDAKSLTYHLNIMKAAAFVRYEQDLLLQRKPVITVADPIVRFHDLIVRPNLVDFELREGRAAWERSRETFSSKVLGPHFEDLARQWTLRHGREQGLDDIGQVGTTTVACREHRGHEVDVVALSRTSRPRDKSARVTLLGEAKATNKPPTPTCGALSTSGICCVLRGGTRRTRCSRSTCGTSPRPNWWRRRKAGEGSCWGCGSCTGPGAWSERRPHGERREGR